MMRRFIFMSLLFLAPALSDVLSTTHREATEAAAATPVSAPAPTIIATIPTPSPGGVARMRSAAATTPTQRPSGLFNSYTCVAVKPYLVCGIVTWSSMNCTTVMDEYEFLAGNCCPLNDYGSNGCRLEVNGPNSFCSYKTRYDRRYFSYLIAPSNAGTCLKSQYEVGLPPTSQPVPTPQPRSTAQSSYAVCFEASYLSCAGTSCAGTATTPTTSYAFRRAYNHCSRSSSAKSAQCVHQASLSCNAQSGRPPWAVCDALPSLGSSGKLMTSSCVRLRRRCRAAPETVACT